MNERMGAEPWLARTRAEYARMLAARGDQSGRGRCPTQRAPASRPWAFTPDLPPVNRSPRALPHRIAPGGPSEGVTDDPQLSHPLAGRPGPRHHRRRGPRRVGATSLVTPDAADAVRRPVLIDRVSPDARDAARPAAKVDLVSPDARDNGRREPAPIVVTQPALAPSEGFDWAAAGIGAGGLALLLVVGAGAATTVRTRRAPAHIA